MNLREKFQKKAADNVWKEKSYQKIFCVMAACMVIAVVILAVATYFTVKKNVIAQISNFSMRNFEETCEVINEVEVMANSMATQLLLNESCAEILLTGEKSILNSMAVAHVARQMSLYRDINKGVDSVYLYNGKLGCLLTSDGNLFYEETMGEFYDKDVLEIISEYAKDNKKKFIRRRISVPITDSYIKEEEVFTFFLDYFKGDVLSSAVIVNCSVSDIDERILNMEDMDGSYMAVWNEKNSMILDMPNLPEMTWDIVYGQVELMREKGEEFGTFRERGKKYVIIYQNAEKTGMNYVRVSRWNDIFETQNRIRNIFCILVTLMIALSVCISRGSSLIIYWPYRKIETEYRRLFKNTRKAYRFLQEENLFDFINGKKAADSEEVKRTLEESGYLKEGKRYSLAVMRINRYEELMAEFGEENISHIKYAFQNIFEEISGSLFEAKGVSYRDGIILFIIGTEGESVKKELEEVFEIFKEKEKVFIAWDFQMMIMEEYVSVAELPELKRKLWTEIENLYFYEPGELVCYEDTEGLYRKQLDYAKLNQKGILEALHSGNRKEIEQAYGKFKKELENCNTLDCQNALIWLFFSVAHVVDEYRDNSSWEDLEKNQTTGGKHIVLLTGCDTMFQANELMERFLAKALQIRERATSKTPMSSKIEAVKAYIEGEFRNPNLSQELLADKFGISTPYLGRQFKRNTGMAVAEYINKIRMDVVMEQIRETNRPVKDIAEENGFGSPKYFYAYFKKKNGTTPQAYREKEFEKRMKLEKK